jgi:hypothetical protein
MNIALWIFGGLWMFLWLVYLIWGYHDLRAGGSAAGEALYTLMWELPMAIFCICLMYGLGWCIKQQIVLLSLTGIVKYPVPAEVPVEEQS